MQKSKWTHIRIRDDNDYSLDIEALIKSIQKEFKIDFRCLPQWQALVKRLHVSQTDYKRRIQYINQEKANIISKLYIQSSRPSPFQLSAELARTASRWQRMKNSKESSKIVSDHSIEEVIDEVSKATVGEEIEIPHPNTEILSTESVFSMKLPKEDVRVQSTAVQVNQATMLLPAVICTNAHKLISPLDSQISQLSCHTIPDKKKLETETENNNWQSSTAPVVCMPSPITIKNNTLDKQSCLFSLTNRSGEILHIRFKDVTDHSPFKKICVLPEIPKRLYPGIAVVFKLLFELKNNFTFKSGLLFKVGRDGYTHAPPIQISIPVVSTFGVDRVVQITDTVNIPPVYPWHIKMDSGSNYPTGTVKITVDDPHSYHLHIYKREVDLSRDSDIFMSMRPSTLNTESLDERDSIINRENTFLLQDTILSKSSEKSSLVNKSEYVTKTKTTVNTQTVQSDIKEINMTEDVMSTIVDDIVQLALDAFVFDYTYLYLHPNSKRTVNVFFTKAEHIGYHQSYYEFELIDSETDTVAIKKSIKVYAEVLPNPIQVTPLILDMSKSPMSHGYYEDHFIVTNTHKVFPVTAYIKLTTKMKKLFYVMPMKSLLPAQSSVKFEVKFCSRHYLSTEPSNDFVHFTFKIVVVGYKTVYDHMPPIFYEIIAPCAAEFKKVYSEKYFKDTEHE